MLISTLVAALAVLSGVLAPRLPPLEVMPTIMVDRVLPFVPLHPNPFARSEPVPHVVPVTPRESHPPTQRYTPPPIERPGPVELATTFPNVPSDQRRWLHSIPFNLNRLIRGADEHGNLFFNAPPPHHAFIYAEPADYISVTNAGGHQDIVRTYRAFGTVNDGKRMRVFRSGLFTSKPERSTPSYTIGDHVVLPIPHSKTTWPRYITVSGVRSREEIELGYIAQLAADTNLEHVNLYPDDLLRTILNRHSGRRRPKDGRIEVDWEDLNPSWTRKLTQWIWPSAKGAPITQASTSRAPPP